MKKFRYGILSTASIVPRFISALRESGTGEVVAIASRSEEKALEKAKEWNIPKSYGSYEALLADPEIEIVYVAMINSQHYEYSLKALEAGKHVICEKPFTLHKSEAEHLFRVAKEKGLFLAEAQKSVFLEVMQEIKELIQSGKLGKIQFVDFTSSCSAVYNTWLHSHVAGGGALAGSASYSVHLAKFLFEEKVESYSGLCTFGDSEVDEQCVLNLNLGGRILFVSKISTNVKAVDRALIFGENGYIEIPEYWKARKAFVHYKDGEDVVLEHPCQYELIYEIQHFDACIRKGLLQSPVMDEAMTVDTIGILEDLREQWNAKVRGK